MDRGVERIDAIVDIRQLVDVQNALPVIDRLCKYYSVKWSFPFYQLTFKSSITHEIQMVVDLHILIGSGNGRTLGADQVETVDAARVRRAKMHVKR